MAKEEKVFFSVVETSDINKVTDTIPGRYIIVDNGDVYYESTQGKRVKLNDVKINSNTIQQLTKEGINYFEVKTSNEIKEGEEGYVTADTIAKFLKEFQSNLTPVVDKIPDIKLPDISVTINGVDIDVDTIRFPKGTKVNIEYNIDFYPGEYEYDDSTGVFVISSLFEQVGTHSIRNELSAIMTNITVDEEIPFVAEVNYSDGDIPSTLMDNKYDAGQIKSNTIRKEFTIIPYIEGCYYGGLTEDVDETNIVNYLSDLASLKDNYTSHNVCYCDIKSGTKAIVVLCPESENGLGTVFNSTVYCYMTESFEKISGIDINGTNYNMWIYKPAEAYVNPANLVITLL